MLYSMPSQRDIPERKAVPFLDPAVERIEVARLERGISVAELARRIGSNRKRLWYVLNGQREMRVEEFLRLCIALSLNPQSFITRPMVNEVRAASMRKGA